MKQPTSKYSLFEFKTRRDYEKYKLLGCGKEGEESPALKLSPGVDKLRNTRRVSASSHSHAKDIHNMENWVDFKLVKEAVSMEQILAHYGISLRRVSPSSLRGLCPLPTHGSKDSKQSFTVNTAKNVWSCLSSSCVAARGGMKGGNLLDFTAAMEQCSVRDAALRLASWFSIGASPPPAGGSRSPESPTPPKRERAAGEKTETGENKPLTFTLKGVAYCDYLRGRGISEETAHAFGIGLFSGRGTMAGRIVIPIHNERGELVAYAGRSPENAEPKYKFPAGFHKSHVLFNLHRVAGDAVVLVEGFFDCLKVWQSGRPVVALMGSSLSEEQERLIADRFSHVRVFLDGDSAGRSAAAEIGQRLMRRTWVRIVELPDGTQPDMLSAEDLTRYLPK